jgi:hypothetical protein
MRSVMLWGMLDCLARQEIVCLSLYESTYAICHATKSKSSIAVLNKLVYVHASSNCRPITLQALQVT